MEDSETIRRAGELHDVRKVAIPDAILRKSDDLDPHEWEFMRRHPLIGERIMEAAPSLTEVARLVRCHHEGWDGAGYPAGLSGDGIRLGSRIIAVADAYHAMITGSRPHRRTLTHAEAIAELRLNSGTQFDPSVVRAFCDVVQSSDRPSAAAVLGDD